MIREGRKLPKDVLTKIPQLVSKISQDPDVADPRSHFNAMEV